MFGGLLGLLVSDGFVGFCWFVGNVGSKCMLLCCWLWGWLCLAI